MNIWLNGKIVDAVDAIDARDRGLTLGDGIFETLAVVDGAPLRLDRHLARLRSGAAALGMPMDIDAEGLFSAISELCENQVMDEGSARVTRLRGPAARGVLPPSEPTPTLMISVARGKVGSSAAIRTIIAKSTRRNEHSPLASIKSTNYLDAIIAAREAAEADADDAVLLNTNGNVAEATAANLFCRFGNDLITPPVSDGALPGIMRACIIDVEDVEERSLRADDLRAADEIFLSSSLSIRPVVALDGHPVGNGEVGAVAARLKDLPRRAR